MPRKPGPALDSFDFYSDLAASVETQVGEAAPDVLEFYDRQLQLGVPLTRQQRLVLKLYYGLPLEEADLPILDAWAAEERLAGLPPKEHPAERVQVLEQLARGRPHQYLVMEAGRRAGKSLLAGIIVTYEFYKLCHLDNPQAHYGIAQSSPITLLVMATTAQQGARTVYRQVQGTVQACPYLVKLAEEGKVLIGQEEISYRDKGLYIHAGNSKSGSQVGQNLLLLVMDEVARFENELGEKNALELWRNLGISGATFGAQARRVAISSAWYEGDAIQQLYEQAAQSSISLGLRLRSWDLNPVQAARDNPLVEEEYRRDPILAALEFEGIRPAADQAFLSLPEIRRAARGKHALHATRRVSNGLVCLDVTVNESRRLYGHVAHLDPAVCRDAFAVAVGHSEGSIVVIDVALAWEPQLDAQVSYQNVYQVLQRVHRQLPLELVTVDTPSQATELVQQLRQLGLRCQVTPFSNSLQVAIYAHLRQLLHENRLVLPADSPWTPLLVRELSTVQLYKGHKIVHPHHSSKDLADAVAAVAYQLGSRVPTLAPIASTPRSLPTTLDLRGRERWLGEAWQRRLNRPWN